MLCKFWAMKIVVDFFSLGNGIFMDFAKTYIDQSCAHCFAQSLNHSLQFD